MSAPPNDVRRKKLKEKRSRISSADRKDQLIQATIALMRRDGVQRLNIRAIAEEAEAPLATVHYCFEGKDDLLSHAVEHWLQRMVEVPGIGDKGGSPRGLAQTVEHIAAAYWTAFIDDPLDVLCQIELVLWAARQPPSDTLAKTIYQRYELALGDIFANALSLAGETSTWKPTDLARTFIALVDGASLQLIADPTTPGHRERFFRTLRLLLADAVRRHR
ncbi:MAG: TetR/AcrR family transcriptional regulator [Hyphomicrobiales bacterium]|nr:TetR/AcrR family transcriptional regulator [Hyphomicrobiales bacterium]